MKYLLIPAFLMATACVHAESPRDILQTYASEAAASQPGFAASARRGEALFHQRFTQNEKMPACATCHTDNPRDTGTHAITGKAIKPLAVPANRERLSDTAKVEKWFGRNCREVIGRNCTPAEKADVVAYLLEAR